MIDENCPCKRKRCERHGKCDECREHHAASRRGRPVACEKSGKTTKRSPKYIETAKTSSMQKAVFFDLDGTLTDSGEGIINCAELALAHFGIPIPDRQTMRQFVGPPLRDTFQKFGVPADRVDEAVAVFRSRYTTVGKFENFPYPGIETLLQRLRAQGFRLYVATSKPEDMSVEILEKYGLAPYFDIICGSTLDGSRDAKASVIAYLLEQIGRDTDAVMVGDTAFDVIGAAAHHIPTIGVSWGYGSVADMEKAGAAAIAHSMDALFSLLTGTGYR